MAGGIIADMVERILSDRADPQTINAARDHGWYAPLWGVLEENGLTLAWVPEDLGGAGLSLAESFEIVSVAGRFALPVPLVETMIAAWLLTRAGMASPPGAMTVAPVCPQDRIILGADGCLSGIARQVPFAGEADHVAVLAADGEGWAIALLSAADCERRDCHGLSDDPRADLILDGVRPIACHPAPSGFDDVALMMMGGVVRSVQIAGALQAALTISVQYANDRVAFGKSIGRFQAVQNILARLAGEVAAAEAAASSAADAVASADVGDDELFLEAAAAKIRSAEAVAAGAAIAHQVHGAIGLTTEHILHRFTLRMQDWRDDFGNESRWAAELGRKVLAGGAQNLWPLIASR